MLITQVMFHVKPEHLEAFKALTLENARNSVREPGIARFDFIQQVDDPTRFMLVEVFRDAEAPARHRESAHFAAWLAAVPDMLVEPRTRQQYANVFPNDTGWDLPPGANA
jgi:autoinducer 2-degrading protein